MQPSLPLIPEVGIVALVPDQWTDLWQPRHHVLSRLARYFPVIWVNPARSWRESWSGPGALGQAGPEPPPGLSVYTPGFWLPAIYRPTCLAHLLFRLRLNRACHLLDRQGVRHRILYLWRPEFAPALAMVSCEMSCYHIDDEYSFSPVELPPDEGEMKLISRADQVIVHSPALFEKKGCMNPATVVVPNGVDYEAYATPCFEPADLAAVPRPRIGYTGWLKKHLDWPLLLQLAEQHPEKSFVFVGPQCPHTEMMIPLRALARRPNVYLLGAKPSPQLAHYPQHFDVCIMPYCANDYTKYIYPLKLHEYLASGRPTVGTLIRSLEAFRDVVRLASTPAEWTLQIEEALSPEANAPDSVALRQQVARRHDWQVLVAAIARTFAMQLGKEYQIRLDNDLAVTAGQTTFTLG